METFEELPNGNLRMLIPIKICNLNHRRSIVFPGTEISAAAKSPLALGVAQALLWQRQLDEGKYASIEALATAVGRDRTRVSRMLRLALLSPEIIHKILAGEIKVGVKALILKGIPADWEKQKMVVGLG